MNPNTLVFRRFYASYERFFDPFTRLIDFFFLFFNSGYKLKTRSAFVKRYQLHASNSTFSWRPAKVRFDGILLFVDISLNFPSIYLGFA